MCSLRRISFALSVSPAGLLCPWNSPGKKTGVCCPFRLLGSSPLLLHLLHWQMDSLPLCHLGSPVSTMLGLWNLPYRHTCLFKKTRYVLEWSVSISACILSHPIMCSHVQRFVTPMNCTPDSSVHGIFQARVLEWVTISSSRALPDPGIKPAFPAPPALQAYSLPLNHERSSIHQYESSIKGERLRAVNKKLLSNL